MKQNKLITIPYTCPNCKKQDTLEWGLKCWKAVEFDLLFKCNDCDYDMHLNMRFPKNKGEKLKHNIESDECSYIG